MTTTRTSWTWQAGTLYRRSPRRWIAGAVLHGVEGVALLLVPAIFLVPAAQTLAETSWGWSVEACFAVGRGGGSSCAPTWALLTVGGALLVGWVVALVAVARRTIEQSREVEIPLHLDARFLHVATPSSFWRESSPISVRWEDVVAIEVPTRGTRTLLLRLVPAAEVIPRNRIERKRPIIGAGSTVTIACGDAMADARVLCHLKSDIARWALATQDGTALALLRAES